ncbi:MAG: hypothetical protein ACK526_09920 [Planctomyces sp.]|jgi:hypothetical protein
MKRFHVRRAVFLAALSCCFSVETAFASPPGLVKESRPEIKSAGALAFGPDQVLFVGDSLGGAIYALEVSPATPATFEKFAVEDVDQKIAALLGTTAEEILINDLAVQPGSDTVYLSVSRGRGPDALPAIVRIKSSGSIEDMPLDDVAHAKVMLNNAPAVDAKDHRGRSLRQEAVTDLVFSGGKLYIAGLSNEEFASKLRVVNFPFDSDVAQSSVEIYHGAHGKYETRAPVRTFVPMIIDGQPNIVAAYTCTPLVKFPVSELKNGEKLQGTTVAELGNQNRPLDLISYRRDGKDHLLLANSARGVMKISTETIGRETPIVEKIQETAGLPYEKLEDLRGVEQLDKVNDETGMILSKNDAGQYRLTSISLP